MTARPRRNYPVQFARQDGEDQPALTDTVAGLRFTILAQAGGEVLVDFTRLRPRRLALVCARALRRQAAPGGGLGVRSTVKAYANSIPRFFAYLAQATPRVRGPEDLRAAHVDAFEAWLEDQGFSRRHLFTVLVKIVVILRCVAAEHPDLLSGDLRQRLRFVSAKPYQPSPPRDAYSPFVARQLRDAARADALAIVRRIQDGPKRFDDPLVDEAASRAHAMIAAQGIICQKDAAWLSLYNALWRRGLSTDGFSANLHGAHHLTSADLVPFLVLLSLETGLEIECCKALTVDCLQNAADGTVEMRYFKRRAHGAEHKFIRVRDGGMTTPGGLIRHLLRLTEPARRHRPDPSLWVYYRQGALVAGVLHPRPTLDAWTQRHAIVDDQGKPFRLLLSRLRKTHKALWYLKTEGHMARFALGHTADVAARAYADLPSLRALHEATVAQAFEDVVQDTLGPRLVTAEQPAQAPANDQAPETMAQGDQDLWLATCSGFYDSPHGQVGSACPTPFWVCLDCANAIITARRLPAILAFLRFIELQRQSLQAGDWAAKFGRAHARITTQILPAFGEQAVATAREQMASEPPIYLPPEARL